MTLLLGLRLRCQIREGFLICFGKHLVGILIILGGFRLSLFEVGLAIENIASGADLNYLGRARLSTRQVKDCLRDLRRLPPMPAVADRHVHIELSDPAAWATPIQSADASARHAAAKAAVDELYSRWELSAS